MQKHHFYPPHTRAPPLHEILLTTGDGLPAHRTVVDLGGAGLAARDEADAAKGVVLEDLQGTRDIVLLPLDLLEAAVVGGLVVGVDSEVGALAGGIGGGRGVGEGRRDVVEVEGIGGNERCEGLFDAEEGVLDGG